MYAVIVHAQPGAQADDIIPRLVPLLNLREETLRGMCARGFVTVESSLSEEEGIFVLARLQAEGLPAELIEEHLLLARSHDEPSLSPSSESPVSSVALFEEEDWSDMMGSLDFLDDTSTTPSTPQEILVTPHARASESPSAGWGALFPDLEEARKASPPVRRTASTPPVPTPPVPTPHSGSDSLTFGAEPMTAPLAPPPQAPPLPMTQAHPSLPQVTSQAPAQPPAQTPSLPRTPGAFQGGQLLHALGMDRQEQPPYVPEGYDPRPPHSPVIARWLSILAPGAGQVYNGEDRLSLDYGLRFFLLWPWIKSVKQAEGRAKKIATYWAPRPTQHNMARTLKYMGAWYLSVAAIIGVCIIAGVLIHDQLTRTPIKPLGPATVAQSVKEARLEVQQARIASLDAMSEMMEEVQTSRSQMSKEERIKRLFIRGFEDCQRGQFASCEETMRRVSDLAEGTHRDAFRLQAWAAMRRRGGESVPMPDIHIVVRSMAEYELLEHKKLQQDPGARTPAAQDASSEDRPDLSSP